VTENVREQNLSSGLQAVALPNALGTFPQLSLQNFTFTYFILLDPATLGWCLERFLVDPLSVSTLFVPFFVSLELRARKTKLAQWCGPARV